MACRKTSSTVQYKCGGGVFDSSLAAESSEVRYPQQEETRKEKINKKTKQNQ
jgi:hypothetical protein